MIKEWRFLKPIIILVVVNGIGNLNYFGITYSFAQEGLGFGYNSMIFGFVQMISFVFSSNKTINLGYTVKNISRKWGTMGFFGAVMCICMLFNLSFVQQSTFISSILFGVSRILSSNLKLILSKCILPDSLYGNRSILSIYPVHCSRIDWGIWAVWGIFRSFGCLNCKLLRNWPDCFYWTFC